MMRDGTLRDTYVAAIQHGLVEIRETDHLVGVVRRPTRWFSAAVDENVPELAPPASLLDEFDAHHEELKLRGMCDEGAHNAAWENLDFESRYLASLERSDAVAELDRIRELLDAGDDVVLVCYENTAKKRCHRTLLRERIESER